MCLSPITIINKNRGIMTDLIHKTTDTDSAFIRVPCGVCSECISLRQSNIVARCRVLSMDHYIFFCTLTYNNESLPRLNVNGRSIAYADYHDVQNMLKMLRKHDITGRNFKYVFVSERGTERGRPHFHGLIFIPRHPGDDSIYPARLELLLRRHFFKHWRRNYGSTRNPDWRPLCTFKRKWSHGRLYQNYDFHYVVPHSTENGESDVAFYVSKYLFKASDRETRLQRALRLNLDPVEYERVWEIVRSRACFSKGFGAFTDKEVSFVRAAINASQDEPDGFKIRFNNGWSAPLPRYYRKYVTADNAIRSVAARGGPTAPPRQRSHTETLNSVKKGDAIRTAVANRDLSPIINF